MVAAALLAFLLVAVAQAEVVVYALAAEAFNKKVLVVS
jgi:hypothetical protein